MSEENKQTVDNEETVEEVVEKVEEAVEDVVEETAETVEEVSDTVEDVATEVVEDAQESVEEAAEVVEAEVVSETANTKTDDKKGINVFTAILLGIGLIVILAFTLGKSGGSLLMDPDNWGQGGRRSYIWVELQSASQADKAANFTFTTPEEVGGYTAKRYWIIDNYIYDIRYVDESGQSYIIMHKCKKNDLVEADTNTYLQSSIVDVDGIQVTLQGSDGLWQSATWANNGYYYQIITGEGNKMEEDYILSLVPHVN